MQVLLVALFMVLAIALPPDERGSQQQQNPEQGLSQPAQPEPPAFQEADETSNLNQPCAKGTDDRDSDLCAQWKAADAAQEAANWTRYSAIAGTVIGVLTLAAAATAAFYAKKAAEHTDTGAQAAINSANAAVIANNVSEMRWVVDNRPWLTIEEFAVKIANSRGERLNLTVEAIVKNFGKTPAYDIELHVEIVGSAVRVDFNKSINGFVERVTQPKDDIWGNTIIFPQKHDLILGMTEIFPEPSPKERYVNIFLCVTYRAKGHKPIFHTALGLWAKAHEMQPRTINKATADLKFDYVSVERMRFCNSVG